MAGMKKNLLDKLPLASLHRIAYNLGVKHHMALSKSVLKEALMEKSYSQIKAALSR